VFYVKKHLRAVGAPNVHARVYKYNFRIRGNTAQTVRASDLMPYNPAMKERLVGWGWEFLARIRRLIVRAYSKTRAETHKPCIALVAAARGHEDAVLEMGGAVGAMIVAAREGNVAVQNVGNGQAINIRYEFRPVNPPPGANVARPQNYIQMLPPGETFVLPVARGVLNNLEYEFIASYQSLGGARYKSRIMLNNLVLTHTSFTRGEQNIGEENVEVETTTREPWTRAERIGFWTLIVAILVGIAALITPEIRRTLGLEKKNPTAAPTSPVPTKSPIGSSNSPATPNPEKQTPPVKQQGNKTSVKGNGNVTGNKVSGTGNAVGNNNQIAAPGTKIINAPNGIVIGDGSTVINPTVNNVSFPLPAVSWAIEDNPSLSSGTHPQLSVKISIDKVFVDAKFAVICDRPCRAVRGEIVMPPEGGMGQPSWGTIPEHPEVAAFVANQPNPMPSNFGYRAYVESADALPVRIVAVKPLTVSKP